MNESNRRSHRRVLTVALAALVALPAAVFAGPPDSWTQWGGPSQGFVAPGAEIADSWGEHGPRRLWSRELGDGYSSIAVADGPAHQAVRSSTRSPASAPDCSA